MTKLNTKSTVWRLLVEVRYEDWMQLLDLRGRALQELKEHAPVSNWAFGDLGLEMRDSIDTAKAREKGFVTINHCGYECRRPATHGYFIDRASKFLMALKARLDMPNTPVTRVGVRTYAFVPSAVDVKALLASSKAVTFADQSPMLKLMPGHITDTGVVIETDGEYRSRFNFGPMAQSQAGQYFPDMNSLPKQGLFVDADLFTGSGGTTGFNMEKCIDFMQTRATAAKDIVFAMADLLV